MVVRNADFKQSMFKSHPFSVTLKVENYSCLIPSESSAPKQYLAHSWCSKNNR